MINQLQNPYVFSAAELTCIAGARNNWDSQRACIKQLKANLNSHFDIQQNEKCCYCGLLYNRTGRGEIDHIAPKGQGFYPFFCFEAYNLAKACQLCNSSTMKHTFNTIITSNALYNQCVFNIVHPYIDNHNWHYSWKFSARRVVISVNNNSAKAMQSIKLFELDSVKRTRARASQRNQERLENLYNIRDAIKQRIKDAITFK